MNPFNKPRAMKTMLIEDDDWVRDSLSSFFESEGCHLLALETAEEGMEELMRQAYDIIIVDYRLPGVDGLEFPRRIQDSQPHAMKILITAYGSKKILSEALKFGAQDFIKKPFTSQAIEDSLSRVIENRQQSRYRSYASQPAHT